MVSRLLWNLLYLPSCECHGFHGIISIGLYGFAESMGLLKRSMAQVQLHLHLPTGRVARYSPASSRLALSSIPVSLDPLRISFGCFWLNNASQGFKLCLDLSPQSPSITILLIIFIISFLITLLLVLFSIFTPRAMDRLLSPSLIYNLIHIRPIGPIVFPDRLLCMDSPVSGGHGGC